MKKTTLTSLTSLTFALATAMGSLAATPAFAAEPIWDANKVEMISEQLAPQVFAFYPKDARELNAKGGAAATSGGLIIGTRASLLIETMLNQRLHQQVQKMVAKLGKTAPSYAVNTSAHGDHSYGNMYLPKSTLIVQHANAKNFVEKHLEHDKAFMIKNFGTQRGIEEIKARTGDLLVPANGKLSVDLGGKTVDIIDFGFGQTGGDLFVWEGQSKTLWAGNVVIAPKPALPWLLDGHLLQTLETLNKVYAFLPPDAKIIPGHGVAMTREDLRWHIDYLSQIKQEVTQAVQKGLSLEQTVQKVALPQFRGYVLFDWVHAGLNVPAAYKDLTSKDLTAKDASAQK